MSGVLVLGGARSGKSRFAEKLARDSKKTLVYLATARAGDDEMQERIDRHKNQRGPDWVTVEEPLALVDALRTEAIEGRIILVDCLTLWLSNLMSDGAEIDREITGLAEYIDVAPVPVIFVSNEVGQGIVPLDRMAREFRDHAGRLHQILAEVCKNVWFVTAGIPQQLKGQST